MPFGIARHPDGKLICLMKIFNELIGILKIIFHLTPGKIFRRVSPESQNVFYIFPFQIRGDIFQISFRGSDAGKMHHDVQMVLLLYPERPVHGLSPGAPSGPVGDRDEIGVKLLENAHRLIQDILTFRTLGRKKLKGQ